MDATEQSGVEPDDDSRPNGGSDPVTIRVLGPLRVIQGAIELDPGPRRSRTVLALLVSEVGRVVTTDRLIDGIWGDDPPPTAKKAVHVHISNLRRALGEGFPLRTAPGGYVLQATGVDVDAVRFRDGAQRATRLLRTDPATASHLLSEMLALWNGPAYADLGDEPALVAEVAGLTELRLQAIERRVDADLRIGRHAEVIGELETLTVDHPYRERLRELHMLALYRSGRQAEALRAYEHTRALLAEELGLEPSPPLRELQHEILEQAASLDLDESGSERYAFLATDLEDSTAMWDTDPESMQEALAQHDRIIDEAVQQHSGHVFKGTGDGVLAVFADFGDAARAAAAAQVRLTCETWPTSRPLRVRMAVDDGPATKRGDDYFGPAMNQVNRIMSSGHGGQILLRTALVDASPAPTRPIGAADYKGLGRIEVAQMELPGMQAEFPPLRTERAPASFEREGFGRSIRGYELRERLGEGAHGFVYRAYQASIGREVAVKVIRPEFANRVDFVKRFEAEAQFIAQLEHPHIVSLYDYWRDVDGAYLAMQLLRGGSLSTSLERAPWRPPAALHLLDQIGTALDYAHRHGVVHRDLKPANVLLDDEGNAYLSDFGIATQHVEAVGLPIESSAAYVSPEELAGATIGPAADVYGLALLTFETLTGERPLLGAQPPPVAEVRSDLPSALDPVLARATDPDPNRRYGRIDDYLRALRQVFGVDVISNRRTAVPADVRNPYKGLRAFGETDANDFFGREALTDTLIAHVANNGFTAVIGPSGCGKSSLVRAGLLPAVRRGVLGTGGDVLITDMFPGSFPFEELEAALLRVAVHGDGTLLTDLLADDRGLLRVSKQILPNDDSELLLVIDQFEELFSLTTDETTRRRFLDSLTTAVGDGRGRVRVVVTMRADFLDRPLAEPDFGAVLGAALVPVAMPTRDELAQSIARPAAAAGLELEAGLVPRVVGDVVDQPGALPMLQHALTELVARRSGILLTMDAYDRTGGVQGALATRAEEIYSDLSEPTQHVARELFLRLVSVDDDSDDTRRRVRRSELDSLGLNEAALDTVLDEFGSFRLLSFDRDPVTRGPTIEVAHEALIREWPRYREWVDERREDLLLERRLDVATGEWETNDRDSSFLLTGGRLEQYEQWAESIDTRLTESERSFLDAGRVADDETAARSRARRRGVLAAVSTLSVLAMILALVAVLQRNDADDKADLAAAEADRAEGAAELAAAEADRAMTQESIAEDALAEAAAASEAEATARADAEHSALTNAVRGMALKAQALSPTDQEAAMLMAIAASDASEAAGLALPEVMEALIETTAANHVAQRFDVRPLFADPFGMRAAIAIGPDSERMVALVPGDGESERVAAIVVMSTGEVERRLDAVESPSSVYWDHDGNEVLVGAEDGEISIWDPTTGDGLGAFAAGGEQPLVFGATGPFVGYAVEQATQDPGVAGFRVIVTNRDTDELVINRSDAQIVRFSPDGSKAVVTDIRGTMYAHDLPSGELQWANPSDDPFAFSSFDFVAGENAIWLNSDTGLFRVDLGTGEAAEVADELAQLSSPSASPNGRWLASTGLDSSIDVFEVGQLGDANDAPEFELRAQDDVVLAVDWLPDSTGFVTLNKLGDAVLWDVTGASLFPERIPLADYPLSFAFLDQDRLALSGFVRGGDLHDLETGTSIAMNGTGSLERTDLFDEVSAAAPFIGRTLGPGIGLEVRDLATGEQLLTLSDWDRALGFSPAADRILVSTSEGGIGSVYGTASYALVDLASGRPIFTVPEFAQGGAFSPDGSHLVVSQGSEFADLGDRGGAPTLVVYDTATGNELRRLEIDYLTYEALEISDDGRRVAVGGQDGVVVLYDFDGLISDPESAEIARTRMSPPVIGIGFAGGGAVVLASVLGTDGISAFDAGAGLTPMWHADTGEQVVDSVMHDGLAWVPRLDASGVGLIGIDIDPANYADFARSRSTRALSAAECAAHLGEACPTGST